MVVKKKRLESKAKYGVLILAVALQGSPAFAAESGGGGFFSSLGRAFSSLFSSSSMPSDQSSNPFGQVSREEAAPAASAEASREVVVEDRSIWTRSGDAEELNADLQVQQAQQAQQAYRARQPEYQYQQTEQAPRPRVAQTPSVPVTTDSSVSISGVIPEGARWLYVMIQKDGEKALQDITPTSGGSSIPVIYLHQGPGKYHVWLYVSKSTDKTVNAYENFSSAVVRNEDTRDNAFLLPSANIQSDDPEIAALSAQITRGLSTDRDKALAIHDWLTREITYDSKGVRTGDYVTRPQDARGVLYSKLAVCDGFSNLFAALSRAAGIQARVITGPLGIPSPSLSREQLCDYTRPGTIGALHAWNEVYVDNRWVTLDATLDTGSTNTKIVSGQPDLVRWIRTPDNHQLFDPSPSLFERNHTKCVEELR